LSLREFLAKKTEPVFTTFHAVIVPNKIPNQILMPALENPAVEDAALRDFELITDWNGILQSKGAKFVAEFLRKGGIAHDCGRLAQIARCAAAQRQTV
jgi:hypothetical protein